MNELIFWDFLPPQTGKSSENIYYKITKRKGKNIVLINKKSSFVVSFNSIISFYVWEKQPSYKFLPARNEEGVFLIEVETTRTIQVLNKSSINASCQTVQWIQDIGPS